MLIYRVSQSSMKNLENSKQLSKTTFVSQADVVG
jgi:hypothetical protein